ncbi:MAG: M24 family metallopeptidase [Nitrososphaerales archaeon]
MRDNYKRLQGLMFKSNVEVLVVSAPENLFYVADIPTGFTAANRLLFCSRHNSPLACVVPRVGEPALVLSAAALDVVSRHTWVKDLRLYATGTYILRKNKIELAGETFIETLSTVISDMLSPQKNTLGIELNDFSALNYEALKKAITNSNIVDASEILMSSRMIKNDEEIRRFKKATSILCKVMHKVEDAMKDRPTEQNLDIVLKSEMMKEGAESWQQTTIAAGRISGPDIYNQPVPRRRIRSGDLIRLDVGCVYKGYTADLSRTYAVDKIHPRASKTYKVLKDAFTKYLNDLKPGTPASSINIGVVEYVRKNLDMEYYRGNVGHGVGVELYDRPLLGPDDHTTLQEGMTLSYEVPYHISGLAGLNIEDSVLITERGKQVVSDYDRDIIVV